MKIPLLLLLLSAPLRVFPADLSVSSPYYCSFVTTADYTTFLNGMAAEDRENLYDEKLASFDTPSIDRYGLPGHYRYHYFEKSELIPTPFLSRANTLSYLQWKQKSAALAHPSLNQAKGYLLDLYSFYPEVDTELRSSKLFFYLLSHDSEKEASITKQEIGIVAILSFLGFFYGCHYFPTECPLFENPRAPLTEEYFSQREEALSNQNPFPLEDRPPKKEIPPKKREISRDEVIEYFRLRKEKNSLLLNQEKRDLASAITEAQKSQSCYAQKKQDLLVFLDPPKKYTLSLEDLLERANIEPGSEQYNSMTTSYKQLDRLLREAQEKEAKVLNNQKLALEKEASHFSSHIQDEITQILILATDKKEAASFLEKELQTLSSQNLESSFALIKEQEIRTSLEHLEAMDPTNFQKTKEEILEDIRRSIENRDFQKNQEAILAELHAYREAFLTSNISLKKKELL